MVTDGPGMRPLLGVTVADPQPPSPSPSPSLSLSPSPTAAVPVLHTALRGQHVVTIGGGTGPYALLSLLKRLPCSVTAIVSTVGSGGSSRRLRDEFGQLPVGDLRQALVALSTSALLWRELFSFRFGARRNHPPRERDDPARTEAASITASVTATATATATLTAVGVSGHNLGNLILSALQDLHGDDLLRALDAAKRLLNVTGDVVPVTLLPTTLCAELADGTLLRGETAIGARARHTSVHSAPATADHTATEHMVEHAAEDVAPQTPPALAALAALAPIQPIRRVLLDPPVPACQRALDAIHRADLIVIGPGDLYTSILPALLVEGVAPAIRASRAAHARTVYVCSLTTKRGETDNLSAADFVREVQRALGGDGSLDRVVLHNGHFPDHLRALYTAHGQAPVAVDDAELERIAHLVPEVVVDDLLATQPDPLALALARHDAARLARAIVVSFRWPVLSEPPAQLVPSTLS